MVPIKQQKVTSSILVMKQVGFFILLANNQSLSHCDITVVVKKCISKKGEELDIERNIVSKNGVSNNKFSTFIGLNRSQLFEATDSKITNPKNRDSFYMVLCKRSSCSTVRVVSFCLSTSSKSNRDSKRRRC